MRSSSDGRFGLWSSVSSTAWPWRESTARESPTFAEISDACARAGMCTSTTQLVEPWYHQRLHSHTLSATRRNAWRNACSIAAASFTRSNKKPPSACCAAASRSVSLVASASRVCRKSSWCRYRDTPAPPCPSYTATYRPSRATSWSSSMYGRWPFAACTLQRSAPRVGGGLSAVWAERPTPAPAKSAMPGRRKQTNHLDIRSTRATAGSAPLEDLRTSVLR